MSGMDMRLLASAFLACLAPVAPGRVAARLPTSEFADTETALHVRLDQLGRGVHRLDFSLAFAGTPSNNVEVALGCDADGDGELAPHETGLVVGWSCGRYFIENFRTGEIAEEAAAESPSVARSLDWHCEVTKDNRSLVSFAATNEVGAAFAALSEDAPAWLYDSAWNLMRLVARGMDAPCERFEARVWEKGLSVFVR